MWNIRKAAVVLNLSLLSIYGAIFVQLRAPLAGGYSDFVSFYTAGKILHRGAAKQLYDLNLQSEIQREIAPNVRVRQTALPFVRPPFEAWIFWPIAHLPYTAAFVLWNLFSCGCASVALLVLRRQIPGLLKIPPFLMLASGLLYFPVFLTILQGQDSLLLLLVYVSGFTSICRGKPFMAGLLLGLGVFKFPLLLPMLIAFLIKGRLRVLAGFGLSCLVLGAISLATVGRTTAAYYPKYLLTIDSLARGVNRPEDMPNLRGLLSAVLPMSHGIALILLILLTVSVLWFGVSKWTFGQEQALRLGFALNVVTTLLTSYHCHVFDLSVLLLPIAGAAGLLLADSSAQPRRLLTWITGLLMLSPLYMFLTFRPRAPWLLAALLMAFAYAVGIAISKLSVRSMNQELPAAPH
jgi:hypothetical protein